MSHAPVAGSVPNRLGIALVFLLAGAWAGPPAGVAQPNPAGSTAAVLSFIDAAAGRVEAVRHWPGAPVDAAIYPFVPYLWDGCPGRGAIMVLLTNPGMSPDDREDVSSGVEFAHRIAARIADRIRARLARERAAAGVPDLSERLLADRTPGDPLLEAVKTFVPLIADLATYERRGYAVFAFITWQGWRCGVILRAVPEGYGIPFVR